MIHNDPGMQRILDEWRAIDELNKRGRRNAWNRRHPVLARLLFWR